MSTPANVESDPRFPSGKWVGFWLDKRLPGKHEMEIEITFVGGKLTAAGRDRVGTFAFDGKYSTVDGKCEWLKQYSKAHGVIYRGFNEGKGIWGTWTLTDSNVYTGGFHIWPEGMSDPTQPHIAEEADPPVDLDLPDFEPERVPELVPG